MPWNLLSHSFGECSETICTQNMKTQFRLNIDQFKKVLFFSAK